MPSFDSNGVSIHYETFGAGQPIVLVHGVTSSFKRNFQNPGWVEFLTRHGFYVIGLDLRGHGDSEKLYEPQTYDAASLSGDVLRLLDHLQLAQVDLMGYSLGGFIALDLAMNAAERFRRIVLGGIGDGAIAENEQSQVPTQIAAALDADSVDSIGDPVLRQYRVFAEGTHNDLNALRAVMQGPFWGARELARVRQIKLPMLVVVGEQDGVAGSAQKLAAAIPHAQLVTIPARNHFSAVGDQRYKDVVLKFLENRA